MIAAHRWAISLFFGGVLVAGPACQNKEQVPTFALSSDAAAREILDRFFRAYVAQDLDTALSYLCGDSPESRAAARAFISRSQAPDSLFRVDRYDIRSVKPSWAGRTPLFVGEVSFPRKKAAGEILHRYHLRAETGCIEDFLPGFAAASPHSATPKAQNAAPGETPGKESREGAPNPDTPPPEPSGREVIEL